MKVSDMDRSILDQLINAEMRVLDDMLNDCLIKINDARHGKWIDFVEYSDLRDHILFAIEEKKNA